MIGKLIPYKNIETVERVETPLSTEMRTALDDWYVLYTNHADWLKADTVHSLNLPAFISSEVARQITIEMKCNITGGKDSADDEAMNPRAQYLKDEFDKLLVVLRQKLEQGCAAGGMVIKPYPQNGHIYFDYIMDWSLYPIAFDNDGSLADVVFPDIYTIGKNYYTRLERHATDKSNVKISQRAFKSQMRDSIGTEVPLSDVPQWSDVAPEATVTDTDGQMFGWYKVASANSIDVDCPLGASVFSKARDVIRQADEQYSRLIWEFEGSELAIDVDPTVLKPRADGKGPAIPRLNERLFRGVDRGADDTYDVFSPTIRDASILNGLNNLLIRVEDLCGLSRGTLSDPNSDARTATELRIMKQRSYATIADNQKSLELCLKDVIRAMDKYATLYHLAPEGEYDVSFEWDDSIITDTDQQMQERMMLLNGGIMGKVEFRKWYFGETTAQAEAAIQALQDEQVQQYANMASVEALLPREGNSPTAPQNASQGAKEQP